jgi:hypothetical protein
LTEIANDVGIGMRDAALNFPFGLEIVYNALAFDSRL